MTKRLTVRHIREMKGREPVTMLTAYDAGMARILDQAGVDILLVGDSLGMVVLGYGSTVPVTMDQMLHHAAAVCRGRERALVVGDMPFGSYQVSEADTVANGVRFLKEAGCDAVKLEGGRDMAPMVRALVRAGVPVMGHLGLTPQTAGSLGGFKVQGRDLDTARAMLDDARALEEAGIFALVLECVPTGLAGVIARAVEVPVIGIGAGPDCDGQVLVIHDLLGLFEGFRPSFVKAYAEQAAEARRAVQAFCAEVRAREFPGPEHEFAAETDFSVLLDQEEG